MKKIYIFLFFAVSSLSACNDYLETIPSKGENEVLNSSEQIKALFNNSDNFNTIVGMPVAESDDNGMTTDIYDQLGSLDENYFNGLAFNIDGVENRSYGDDVFTKEYNRIFIANLVINGIDNVSDFTDTTRSQYLAQAHFLRAMAEWNLVNTYCMPYSKETLSSPGISLKTSTNYDENMTRATIGETYDAIKADLQFAYKNTTNSDVEDRWMVSRPAAAAMLARYYLFTQDYTDAAKYAEEALESKNASLDDYNNLSLTAASLMSPDGELADVEYSGLYNMGSGETVNYKENYYTELAYVMNGLYLIPSESLINLYDHHHDLRFRQFFGKNTLYEKNVTDGGDNICYHKFYDYMHEDEIEDGPTVPEMLLTVAEALARQGQITDAMKYVNRLRTARFSTGADDTKLSASSQQQAVEEILDERHREMPFLMRWFDIRRLAFNDVIYNDIKVSHTFYSVKNNAVDDGDTFTYTLPVKSARYAQPIPNLEIKRSNNQIVQNEYPGGCVEKQK